MAWGNNKIAKWSTWITVQDETFDKNGENDFALFYTKESGSVIKKLHKDLLLDILKKGNMFLPLQIILCPSSKVYIAMTKEKVEGKKHTVVFWIKRESLADFENYFDLAWMWKIDETS